MAVFNGYNFVGFLDENESRGLIFIKNKKILSLVPLQEKDDYKGSGMATASIRITDNKTKIKTEIIDGSPVIDLKINVAGEVAECDYATGFYSNVEKIEKDFTENIRNDIQSVIDKVQKIYKSDVFGFGYKLAIQHNKEWAMNYRDKWEDIFPGVTVNVDVKTQIMNTGVQTGPILEK